MPALVWTPLSRSLWRSRPWERLGMTLAFLAFCPIYSLVGLFGYQSYPGGVDFPRVRILLGLWPPVYFIFSRLIRKTRWDIAAYWLGLLLISTHSILLAHYNGMTDAHLGDHHGVVMMVLAVCLGAGQAATIGLLQFALFALFALGPTMPWASAAPIAISPVTAYNFLTNLFFEVLLMSALHASRAKAYLKLEDDFLDQEKQMLQSLAEGVVLQDNQGRIVHFNPQVPELLGAPAHELRGKTWMELFGPEDYELWDESGSQLKPLDLDPFFVHSGANAKRQLVLGWSRKSTSKKRWLRISRSADPGSKIFSISDQTEQMELKSQRLKQEQLMAESARLTTLGELAAGVGHEINNPLAAILLKLEWAKNELTAGHSLELGELLTTLERHAVRIKKITSSLRTMARDSRQDDLERVTLGKLVRDTLELVQNKALTAGTTLQIDFSSLDSETVFVRPGQIVQVLLNLLQNSLDAMEGQPKKTILVEGSRVPRPEDEKNEAVCMRVSDTGPGIPEAVRDRIMEPFFTTKPPSKGTGLGLTISRTILSQHGGALTLISSNPTCFELSFPRQRTSAAR